MAPPDTRRPADPPSNNRSIRKNCHSAAAFVLVFFTALLGKVGGVSTEECVADDISLKTWDTTEHTLCSFIVAGRNLALYNGTEMEQGEDFHSNDEEPFELYQDFNLEDQIKGNEGWWDLITYQQQLQRPSLSFYADKVARKRWLPTMGFDQPRVFLLKYGDELTESNAVEDQAAAILKLLPEKRDYVAKPSHMSLSYGTWFVGYSKDGGVTLISRLAEKLNEQESDIASQVARSLSSNLHRIAHFSAPWPTRNARAGVVVEERFSAHNNEDAPPLEFKLYTIWGRVWIGQFVAVEDAILHIHGYVYRNGTMVKGSGYPVLPEWINWQHMVDIAERQGVGKDLFRTDIFVGVPAGSVKVGASEEERIAAVQYVLNEVAIAPTSTLFDSMYEDPSRPENALSQEGARLWIAGYKMGNYRVVPNTEIPREYLDTGRIKE